MAEHYRTISKKEKTEIVIQKSRFIGHVAGVETEEEALQFLDGIRKEHREASHNCFAYVVGKKQEIQRFNDDGEPGGTAGMPILEVIKNNGLTNVIVVVTRYFGGILLGAGGLVRAYSQAAAEVIRKGGISIYTSSLLFRVGMEYPLLGRIENFLRNSSYAIQDIQYSDKVFMDVMVREEEKDAFIQEILDRTDGRIQYEISKKLFFPWEKG